MSNPDLFRTLHDNLQDDIDNARSFPALRPLLAHYTSIDVLEKIILNKEVWFSNPLAMNDREEMSYGMNLGASAFRVHTGLAAACGAPGRHARMLEVFEQALRNFWDYQALETYVFCASEHAAGDVNGKLSQWRGYGGNGFGAAIVFNTATFGVGSKAGLIIAPVVYRTRDERQAWVVNRLDKLARSMSEAPQLTDDQLAIPAQAFFERLKLATIFSKDEGFSEEREWRALYRTAHDSDRLFKNMLSHAVVRNGIEPKLKLKLEPLEGALAPDTTLEKLVDRIILGPSRESGLVAATVKRLLVQQGMQNLAMRVFQSTTPFRPT